MARTKQEIRNFLNGKVGTKVVDRSNARLNGQCVALIKSLMEFLGVPNPYAARGNAKDAGDTYLRQGIAKAGSGWLNVCVNKGMGGGYGHIWIDLDKETNYESNGAKALITTKGTRPLGQAQQIVNLDKYIKADPVPVKPTGNVYGKGYITNSPVIGRIASFMRSTFPKYTKPQALGNTYGPYLTASITRFQKETKLVPDGICGPITQAKLKQYGWKG